jgi:hypothetical protein
MSEAIPIAVTKRIRDCGLDESWLQDQIAENPDCLQLGDLVLVSRERRQAGGGRLDILLKNPQDESMYEVEVMLGDTDETHIIRTIEYWDREKRRWPQRQHYAVLVAESITSRFFNVVQLLSHCIPIIAVQVNVVETDGRRLLHFSKVLDTYQEPEIDSASRYEEIGEEYWEQKASWTLSAAKALVGAVSSAWGKVALRYVKSYIVVIVDGDDVLTMWQKGRGKSGLVAFVSEEFRQSAKECLDNSGIPFIEQKDGTLYLTVDPQMINSQTAAFSSLAGIMKDSWRDGEG